MNSGIKEKRKSKKKNKNSRFMRNAKGFAKQGIYGRGSHIADDQYSYFINILDTLKGGFEDVEEKVNMANNVFEQTLEQEEHLASNQIVSKALESLVGFVEETHFERFIEVFSKNLRPICSDRFASHVLQKILEIAFLRGLAQESLVKPVENTVEQQEVEDDEEVPIKRIKIEHKSPTTTDEVAYNLKTKFADTHREACRNFVLRLSKFLLNNLEDFVWDPCTNHIMRAAIFCLVGVHMPKVAFEKSTGLQIVTKAEVRYVVPAEWLETMKEYAQRLEMWPQFVEFPYSELTSTLMGVICIALKAVDKNMLKHIGRRLLNESFLMPTEDAEKKQIIAADNVEYKEEEEVEKPEETLVDLKKFPLVFQQHCAVMLLETLLIVAGRKLFTQLYAMLFATRCAKLAQHAQTNFAVQRLLQNIANSGDFEEIYDELQPHLETLLKLGHTGVVAALGETCLRLGIKQATLLLNLQQALHTVKDAESTEDRSILFFPCLVKLKPYEIVVKEANATVNNTTTYVHLHGSLLTQYALKFNKPIFLVNSILGTPPSNLIAILNTPNGSHIADAFMCSKFIGEKSRERFIRHLDGFYVDLAVTKFGSRVLEACYKAAQDVQKGYIVKQLAEKINMLRGTTFGRLLYSKFRIETYRLSAAQWRDGLKTQHTTNKTQELFKDIIK